MSAYDVTPVFDSVINSKALKHNIMSFYYSNINGTDGEITIGCVDKSKFTGDLKYYKVINKYYWTIQLDDILLNGKSLGLCSGEKKCNGIVDTGTSLITGPTNQLPILLNAIQVKPNCQGYNSTQELTFVISGDHYTFTNKDYILKNTDDGYEKCTPLLMPLDIPDP